MITKENYLKANIKLELLLKDLELGKNVDDELIRVSNIIEEYESIHYNMDLD